MGEPYFLWLDTNFTQIEKEKEVSPNIQINLIRLRTDVNSVQQPKVNSIQKEPVVRQNIPDNRISVPPVQPPVSAMNVPQGATNVGKKGKDEKEIFMFHLLMHYSKENKEKYRQQKQEKNSGAKKSNNV